MSFLQKKFDIVILILLYFSLIIGFFLNEDLNGGARSDYEGYKIIIKKFNENLKYFFLNYNEFGNRHSPVTIILLSFIQNIFLNDVVTRFIFLHINLLLIPIFFCCLKIRFPFIKKNIALLIAGVIFLSPTFRSLTIWPDSRILGVFFFTIGIFFYLKFTQKNYLFKYAIFNTFFIVLASYISPNFSVFSIFFLFKFLKKISINKIILLIVINFLLSLPALYYIFFLDIFFFTAGKTPGLYGDSVSLDFNLSNKILIISSIVFFHLLIFLREKEFYFKISYLFGNKVIILVITLFHLILCFFFNYLPIFTGGGFFFQLSHYLFNGNELFFLISLISLIFIFSLCINSFSNFMIFSLLIISNLQLTIYHKYYEPLIFILFFLLLDINLNFKNFFKNKKNLIYLYAFNLILPFAKFYKKIFFF